ncbi:unnamed protein product, partial [Prorocentrum cordatum]
ARAAREPAATMAPGRASRGSSGGGGSCLRPALFAWFLALAALVVYANFSYTPQSSLRPAESSSEEDAAPRPQEAAAGPVLAAAAGPTEVLAKAAPAEAAPGRAFRGQPLPAASPGPPPPAVAPSGAAQGAAPGEEQRQRRGPRPTVIPDADYEDNAPWPGPRPGDRELPPRETRSVFPGADQEHLHGLLGRLPNGELRVPPTPLPQGGLSQDEKSLAHLRGQCYNARASDATSIDRHQPDKRSSRCKELHHEYTTAPLPSASVVMVFHNE